MSRGTDRVLLESERDVTRREVEVLAIEPIVWVAPGTPEAAKATVWFCPGPPPSTPVNLPALQWIHSGWAGIEGWLERPEWREDILLTRTVGDFPERIAEYVFGFLLAELLGAREALRQMEARTWKRWVPGRLAGRSLLVVGHGAIGRRIAEVGRSLGMPTRGIRRGPLDPADLALGIEETEALPALLPNADVVVNVLPLTQETRLFWNRERFARMKAGAIFVNVSRGATVDEAALLEALAAGAPGRAILDVFQEEPLPPDHPLRGMEGVWITPHVAGVGTSTSLATSFAANWNRWVRGEPLWDVVDRARGY